MFLSSPELRLFLSAGSAALTATGARDRSGATQELGSKFHTSLVSPMVLPSPVHLQFSLQYFELCRHLTPAPREVTARLRGRYQLENAMLRRTCTPPMGCIGSDGPQVLLQRYLLSVDSAIVQDADLVVAVAVQAQCCGEIAIFGELPPWTERKIQAPMRVPARLLVSLRNHSTDGGERRGCSR